MDTMPESYDEREMFSPLYPIVSAYPTPRAVSAMMPRGHRLHDPRVAQRDLGDPPSHHAIRRRGHDAWSADNVIVVEVPGELVAMHALEVEDVLEQQPRRPPSSVTRPSLVAPYNDAVLGLIRGRFGGDPERWAETVAHADEHAMIVVAEQSRDWAPWVPLIRYALGLRQLDETHIVLRAAEHRLRLIARRLLDAQGFTDVRVDDTLNATLALQGGLSAMLGD